MNKKIVKPILIALIGIVLVLAIVSGKTLFLDQRTSQSVRGVNNTVPTLSPTITPTETPTPTLIPTATPKLIYIKPTTAPTVTSTPLTTSVPSQQLDILDKTTVNDYTACKSACPKVKGESSCITNEDGTSSCTISNSHPDPICIDACKSKYGLTF